MDETQNKMVRYKAALQAIIDNAPVMDVNGVRQCDYCDHFMEKDGSITHAADCPVRVAQRALGAFEIVDDSRCCICGDKCNGFEGICDKCFYDLS